MFAGKKIMLERSLREGMNPPPAKIGISRPTNLPNLIKDGQPNGQKLSFDSVYTSQCGHAFSLSHSCSHLRYHGNAVVTMATIVIAAMATQLCVLNCIIYISNCIAVKLLSLLRHCRRLSFCLRNLGSLFKAAALALSKSLCNRLFYFVGIRPSYRKLLISHPNPLFRLSKFGVKSLALRSVWFWLFLPPPSVGVQLSGHVISECRLSHCSLVWLPTISLRHQFYITVIYVTLTTVHSYQSYHGTKLCYLVAKLLNIGNQATELCCQDNAVTWLPLTLF